MNTRTVTLAFLLLIPVMLGACSDSTSPGDSCSIEDDLMLQTGNWWVYERTYFDENNEKIPGISHIDSTVVEGTIRMLGRTAYMMVTYYQDRSADTIYYAVNGSRAYTSLHCMAKSDTMNPADISACMENRWLTVAGCADKTWRNIDTTITLPNALILLPDTPEPITMTGTVNVQQNGLVEEPVALPLGDSSVTVREHRLTLISRYTFEPTEHIGNNDGTDTSVARLYLAPNIGIVRYQRDAIEHHVGASKGKITAGFRRDLLRYSVR